MLDLTQVSVSLYKEEFSRLQPITNVKSTIVSGEGLSQYRRGEAGELTVASILLCSTFVPTLALRNTLNWMDLSNHLVVTQNKRLKVKS